MNFMSTRSATFSTRKGVLSAMMHQRILAVLPSRGFFGQISLGQILWRCSEEKSFSQLQRTDQKNFLMEEYFCSCQNRPLAHLGPNIRIENKNSMHISVRMHSMANYCQSLE